MNTSELHKRIMLDFGARADCRLWRNNVGQLRNDEGNWVRFGVCNPGGSDLIGLRSIVVAPEDVGRRLAVFVGIEAKMGTGRPSEHQQNFIRVIRAMGGLAGVAHSSDEAGGILGLL